MRMRDHSLDLGFREIGVYQKHGQLDGAWRDVIVVELLISANLTP